VSLAVAMAIVVPALGGPALRAQQGGPGGGRGGAPGTPAGNRSGGPSGPQDLRVLHVQGNVHLIAGAGANVLVQVGPLGPVVVDPGPAQMGEQVLAAIRTLSPRPVRYVINTHLHADHTGANDVVAAAGSPVGQGRGSTVIGAGLQAVRAEIIANEQVLQRMGNPPPPAKPLPVLLWPTTTYSNPERDFFTNGEGVQMIHQPDAHTDGDSLVFFRRSDVIAAGDIYSTVSYPRLDLEAGGSINGVIHGLNRLLALAIAGEKTEGGTMIVPGHGRISDEADLVEYRDMVTIIRDRVQDLIGKGRTLDQIKAARPTFEFDAQYGNAPGWTTEQFVEAVYRSLRPPTGTTARR
jgi:glyoxylase-like metal-dependent hydrolase (beta-lactamase superfamily II)